LRRRQLALRLMLIAAMSPAALGDGSSKPHGAGGRFAVYTPIIKRYNRSGERFRIEGACRSACTLFLSIKSVCIERSTFLSFHAGPDAKTRKWVRNSSSTRAMLAAYKPKLRKFLLDGHHVDSAEYFTMSGARLIDEFGYNECPPACARAARAFLKTWRRIDAAFPLCKM
jgi:hypothetical protein